MYVPSEHDAGSATTASRRYPSYIAHNIYVRLVWSLHVRFEVLSVVTMTNAVLWDVAPCRYCINRRFGGTYRLHLQGRRKKSASEEAARAGGCWMLGVVMVISADRVAVWDSDLATHSYLMHLGTQLTKKNRYTFFRRH
jgi:hypothetical protein